MRDSSKSLAALYPAVARQLHPTLNDGLKPESLAAYANKHIWWQCAVDPAHVWQAAVANRSKGGTGCPYCVAPAKSLATLYPETARQLHASLNDGLTADKVTAHSKKRLWWQCDANSEHVWDAEVSNRTKGTGCPFCAHKKADQVSSILALFPDIAAEWHDQKNGTIRPENILPLSNKIFWWRCQKDKSHEWRERVFTRTSYNAGCPFCGERVVTDTNRLSVRCPEIAAEFDPKLNRMLYPKSEHNRGWFPKNRLSEQDRPKRNRMLTANDITYNTKEEFWWRCSKNAEHVWHAPVNDRTKKGYGCPFCSNKRVASDNNLASKYPAVAKRFHPARNAPKTPEQIIPGSETKYWWRCFKSADHIFFARVCQVVQSWRDKTNGCPYCTSKKVAVRDSLSAKYPGIVALLHPSLNQSFKATEVLPNSKVKAWFLCPNSSDHQWQAPIARITKAHLAGRTGCPYCAGRKIAEGGSLLSRYPQIAEMWDIEANGALEPSAVVPGSNKKVHFRCSKSAIHQWAQQIVEVVEVYDKGRPICPICRAEARKAQSKQ